MKTIKLAKILYIICSVLLCGIGLLLIIDPVASSDLIFILIGCILIVFGGSKIVGYFSYDMYHLAFQFDLALGIFVTALGIAFIIRPSVLIDAAALALGLYVFIDGAFKIQTAADAQRFGMSQWWIILLGAIFCIGLGVTLIFNPFGIGAMMLRFVGIGLLTDGAQNLFNAFYTVRTINRRNQELDRIPDRDELEGKH